IFDEPTTGLHLDDVAMLMQVFQGLVKRGNSIVVIEHNLEVIKCADWVIDLGPEAGDDGGQLVAAGTPEAITKLEASHTGKFLKPLLSANKKIIPFSTRYDFAKDEPVARAAETPSRFHRNGNGSRAIQVHG